MGICLCYLDISLMHKGYCFKRELYQDSATTEGIMNIATYHIK